MRMNDVTLDDKYDLASGRVFISGIQALVRLAMIQRERDRAAGLNTAGFISGYRGSPLGALDNELWRQRERLTRHDIVFQPGLNEDLAATAVWGSQQATLRPGATVDGVFGMWYGKAPGVDRSMDVLKHANITGTSKFGGVLAIAGDDHGCQSSTLPSQSEQLFEAAMMPVLNPSNVQEYLDFGLLGFALSRYSGCWIGFKAISETVETAASIELGAQPRIVIPDDFELPPGGLSIRWPDPPLVMERRLHGPKMDAVAAFARANAIDRIVLDAPRARLGIVTTGKAYLDVRQALDDLGLDDAALARIGVRVYKIGLSWPIETRGALRFAEGLEDILVVEEKRAFVETQFVRLLYNLPASRRPSIVGKRDETGARLLDSEGDFTATQVARAIVQRLARLGEPVEALLPRVARMEAAERHAPATSLQRLPTFCSGCPHNTSTVVPEGSHAMAGIGCHGMAIFMPHRNTTTHTQMGGEGANWIGQAPFRNDEHIFQNLGDGTYNHSGSIALRAAAAAGISITYKILVNDAVAMTGGQPVEGSPTVQQIARQVDAEGAKRIAVVTDQPEKYDGQPAFPAGVTVHHRDELDAVQRELREVKGLTVIVYDQTCAAEKRRRRKRGQLEDPPVRAFINDAVCEGCGDCSVQSNCISITPVETELGRKRRIDQSSCNKDLSCLKGFCPSFVTVHGGSVRKRATGSGGLSDDVFRDLPLPVLPSLERPFGIFVTGVGGTGVLTIGALLGMAAHLEGKGTSVLDFTGMSQKNGAVVSHVRIAASPDDLRAVRIGAGACDLLLACDLVVAAGTTTLSRIGRGTTRAVVNTHEQPTSEFIRRPDLEFGGKSMQDALRDATGADRIDFIDANGLATKLLGDSIGANLFMLGFAFQRGLVPVGLDALMRAVELNGVAVAFNRQTFALGRLAAHRPDVVRDLAGVDAVPQAPAEPTPDALIADRAARLVEYQNEAWADRYRATVARARQAAAGVHGGDAFVRAVAHNFHKLMAYKDEYEVARLYSAPRFAEQLSRQFEGDVRIELHLAPPLLARRDPLTGRPRKLRFGPWVLPVLRGLARLRGLRGTPLDVFGYTAERRAERQLIADYEQLVVELCAKLDETTLPAAIALAKLPEDIRGFGPVKLASMERVAARRAELLDAFRHPSRPLAAAA